ncbi:hypothetical protein AAC387_Pa10g2092 [Persea americana]
MDMVDCVNSESSCDQEGRARIVPKVEPLDLESSSKPDCTKRAEDKVGCVNDGSSSGLQGGARTVPKVEALELESSSKPDCTKRAEDMAVCVNGGSSSGLQGRVRTVPKVEALDWESSSKPYYTKRAEESSASSSSQLKSHFVGMGFAPALVERAIDEHGEEDIDLLLETLFTYSALQKSSAEPSDFPDGIVSPCKDEIGSPVEFSTDDSLGLEESDGTGEVSKDIRNSLLMMNFSVDEVDLAIERLGEDAPISELVDLIIAAQTGGTSGEKDTDESIHGKNVKVVTTETLFGTMNKTLRLLEMGFTGDEVSAAIDRFGAEVPVLELADSIFAYQIANTCVEDDKKPSDFIKKIHSGNENNSKHGGSYTVERMKRCHPVTKIGETEASSSNGVPYAKDRDSRWIEKAKKAKWMPSDGNTSFCIPKPEPSTVKSEGDNSPMPDTYTEPCESADTGPTVFEPQPSRNLHQLVAEPPYFFYGNVVNISEATWTKVSQFLYAVEPEFVNCQFFSALIRKEGYVHNLPTDSRSYIHPRPPMTIEDALPHTRKWWPSWDTRKQLICIRSETTGITQTCERLGRMLIETQGVLSKEQQTNILHQCKTLNLVWVGQYKLNPIEAHQVEGILGYPMGHTQVGMISPIERLRLLKYNYQTDTLGFYLSPLKGIFPDGLTVLSLFSGIGGAEVALHRLGIHLKCVVSVDSSKVNREILRKWWSNTSQTGELRLFDDIQKLTSNVLESLIREFGGFDIVIAGNPSNHVFESPKIATGGEIPVGVDFGQFYEFVRVFQRVRGTMGRNR